MVPKRGLEPRRPKALPPQDSVSTSFTTSARSSGALFGLRIAPTSGGRRFRFGAGFGLCRLTEK